MLVHKFRNLVCLSQSRSWEQIKAYEGIIL